jgi:Ca-activated chloride channel family protein
MSLSIVSGSENKSLQPIIEQWAHQQGVNITISYQGSVDIYRLLQQGNNIPFDAIWPANHLWIELGDEKKVVKHEKSIMRSPVVLGVKKSIAQQLGWVDNPAVKIQDILHASEQGKFRLSMTSATQSNSGSSAYIGFLYAMAGYPDTLTDAHLNNPEVQKKVKKLLGMVNRSSGSSGWLKDAFVGHPDRFDAMFNYEAMLIEANQSFTRNKQEPLCAIYPEDGLMVADSPLGFIAKQDAESADKEALFLKLQQHLLSKAVQQKIEATGRRTGLLGMNVSNTDKSVWNPAWCIDTERDISPIPTPAQAVIQQALNLYQTDLRKPSLTLWTLDVSGSMKGAGITGLKQAMTTLLDSKQAAIHLLQAGKNDITYIIPFNHETLGVWEIKGNDKTQLATILQKVSNLNASGGTDLYRALVIALRTLQPYHDNGTLWNYLPAIVAMTDGRSQEVNKQAFNQVVRQLPYAMDIPIHAIAFGDADKHQLEALAEQSVGRLFDSHGDLAKTLRKAKGYN